jgi:hypothetical protein
MYHTILTSLAVACLASLLVTGPARAAPEAPVDEEAVAEDEDPDESLAKSLLGKSYSGELEIEGWTNLGGGLVSPPVYVNQYQREDGTSLVVTSKVSNKDYVVTDALIISKPWKGYVISTSCMQGEDFTLRFVAETRGLEDKEWWTEVRRAWEIEVPPKPNPEAEAETPTKTEPPKPESETASEAKPEPKPEPMPGKITKANPKGVKCTSPAW